MCVDLTGKSQKLDGRGGRWSTGKWEIKEIIIQEIHDLPNYMDPRL